MRSLNCPEGNNCNGERYSLIHCGVNMAAEFDGISDQEELDAISRCFLSSNGEEIFEAGNCYKKRGDKGLLICIYMNQKQFVACDADNRQCS